MATIVVTINCEQPGAEIVRRLRSVSSRPVGELVSALKQGTPFLSARLTFNDHNERSAELRAVLQVIGELDLPASFFSVEEGDPGPSDSNRMTADDVEQTLGDWERALARIHLRDGDGSPSRR